MTRQSAFSFDWPDDWRQESFIVSDANRLAFETVTHPYAWPFFATLIQGGEASGKTHLAHIFAENTGAVLVDSNNLGQPHWQKHRAYVIDDVAQFAGNREAEEALFHLYNAARANDDRLLWTASNTIATASFVLLDLQSRIVGSTLIALDFPDEDLLGALYTKFFYDRQILVKPDAITYLVNHTERSFAAVHHLVQAIDRWALATGKPVTIPAIKKFLDTYTHTTDQS